MISGSYPPMHCGVGDYTARLSRALRDRGDVELEVLSTLLPVPIRDDPPWVRRIMPNWRVYALPRLIAAAREFRPDLVHVQYPAQGYRSVSGPVLIPLLARWRLSAPVVVTLHEYLPPAWTVHAVPFWGAALAASAIVVVRPDYREHLAGPIAWLMRDTPLRLIPNASVIPAVELSATERTALRERLGCGGRRLICFFGFAYPPKGVDQLFRIADPERDHLLLIGELSPSDAYHRQLRALADSDRWRGKSTVTGFVEPGEAARWLAASDAAIFPFSGGGGTWNSSLHAATSQGTFAIVTSNDRNGYAPEQNIYYAAPGAIEEMRAALADYAGRRSPSGSTRLDQAWAEIAGAHSELYRAALSRRSS